MGSGFCAHLLLLTSMADESRCAVAGAVAIALRSTGRTPTAGAGATCGRLRRGRRRRLPWAIWSACGRPSLRRCTGGARSRTCRSEWSRGFRAPTCASTSPSRKARSSGNAAVIAPAHGRRMRRRRWVAATAAYITHRCGHSQASHHRLARRGGRDGAGGWHALDALFHGPFEPWSLPHGPSPFGPSVLFLCAVHPRKCSCASLQQSLPQVCTHCLRCTARADKCALSAHRRRVAGAPCGCGDGEPGCERCGMCAACADELPCGRELGGQSRPLMCDGEVALAEIAECAPPIRMQRSRCHRSMQCTA